jgi:hypothetical protein
VPRIEVVVDREGGLRADFSGFPGTACEEESQNLERALRALGLPVKVRSRVEKSPAQTAAECRLDDTGTGPAAAGAAGAGPPGGRRP